MKFTPKYTVSYKGAFQKAGVPFDIDPEDREEMEHHGVVEAAKPVANHEQIMEGITAGIEAANESVQKNPVRKGRPRKVVEE